MRAQLLLAIVMVAGCSGYNIFFANDSGAPIQLTVKASDGSLFREASIASDSSIVISLKPHRDCDLSVTVTQHGTSHTSQIGYYEPSSVGTECYLVHADGMLEPCDRRRGH